MTLNATSSCKALTLNPERANKVKDLPRMGYGVIETRGIASRETGGSVDALLALYAKDSTIESPLIPHLKGTERGVSQAGGNEVVFP